MGSLMAGWASPVKDPKAVKYQRNRSLTREEIDTYWKSKKQKEEDHQLNEVDSEEISKQFGKIYQKSSSMPLVNNTTTSFLDTENDDHNESLEKLLLKNGWWTSSSSAFLNEPPVIEEESNRSRSHNKYTSQFHVANFDVSKTNGHVNISA